MSELDRDRVRVVIPAKNEAPTIGRAIDSVRAALARTDMETDIVVVDNGSEDATAQIAERHSAQVIDATGVPTIAALRNLGAEGDANILVFLDADVTVADDWGEVLRNLRGDLLAGAGRVTGSEVRCPRNRSRWLQSWFSGSGRNRSYINSGHLVVSSSAFQRIGGFDARLITAEDHDFCVRAKMHGIPVTPEPSLVAFHHGVPQTLSDFFRQQLWHGSGSVQHGAKLFDSITNVVVVLLACVWCAALLCAILFRSWQCPLTAVLLHSSAAGAASLFRPRRRWVDLPRIWVVYVVYFAARIGSLFSSFIPSLGKHWKRPQTATEGGE